MKTPKFIEKLTTARSPIIMFLHQSKDNPLLYEKAMGFTIENFGNGIRLVATCRHAYQNKISSKSLLLTKKRNIEFSITEVKDDQPEQKDLAFFILKGENLATNFFNPKNIFEAPKMLVKAQNATTPEGSAAIRFISQENIPADYSISYDYKDTHSRQKVNLGTVVEGKQMAQILLNNQKITNLINGKDSHHGASGSPLFDTFGSVYGMVIGGGINEEGLYECGYIPIEQIRLEVERLRPKILNTVQRMKAN